MKRRLGGLLLRLIAVAAVVALCAYLVRGMDLPRVAATLRRSDLRLVAVAVLINLTLNLGARISRWRVLLDPLPRTGARAGFGELGGLLFASYAMTNLLPARAGEVLRTVHLNRRHGYPAGALVASQLVEKVVEALSLGLLAVPVIFWARPPLALTAPLALLAVLGLGGVAVMFVVSRGAQPTAPVVPEGTRLVALRQFYHRLAEAVALMHSPAVWARALAWSFVSDLADVLMIGLCLHAVGVSQPLSHWCVVYLALNLIIAVPSTPAQVGVLEAGAVLALTALGVGGPEALAFAVIYHAAHVLPTTAVGLVAWALLPRGAVNPPAAGSVS